MSPKAKTALFSPDEVKLYSVTSGETEPEFGVAGAETLSTLGLSRDGAPL